VAARMMLTNLPLDADEAYRLGFVAAVHPAGQLEAAAEELALRLSRMPSGAIRRAKQLLQASLGNDAEEQVAMEVGFIVESFATDDFREGVTAFIEKRKPEFAEERQ
jgi:2-(1,2-epoxy-1,2-dihydrophenyl)acetyl-CoA isomerase